jgi:hypothetical protein
VVTFSAIILYKVNHNLSKTEKEHLLSDGKIDSHCTSTGERDLPEKALLPCHNERSSDTKSSQEGVSLILAIDEGGIDDTAVLNSC